MRKTYALTLKSSISGSYRKKTSKFLYLLYLSPSMVWWGALDDLMKEVKEMNESIIVSVKRLTFETRMEKKQLM